MATDTPADGGKTNAVATDTPADGGETNAVATDTLAESEETTTDATNRDLGVAGSGPDLVWDHEAPGLCVRVHGNGAKSFLFVYRMAGRQRFLRIGGSPGWTLASAQNWAKELRTVVEEGGDPEGHNRERQKIGPVENVIRYIAEQLGRTV